MIKIFFLDYYRGVIFKSADTCVSKELIQREKNEWIEHNFENGIGVKPRQFNINKLNVNGEDFWMCEFDEESCWENCTTMESGSSAEAIFDNPKEYKNDYWEEEWTVKADIDY